MQPKWKMGLDEASFFDINTLMIQIEHVQQLVLDFLKDSDYQLHALSMDEEQNIVVEISREGGVFLDKCVDLNKYLVEQLGDLEDFSMEVGSPRPEPKDKTKKKLRINK